MKRYFLPLALLAGGLLLGGSTQARVPLDQQVVVASRLIHTVRANAGGLSAQDRVAQINERLPRIIAHEPLNPSNIYLRNVNGDPAIYVGRYIITSVTWADAIANHTTPMGLARQWLRAYRRVLPQARPDMNWGVVSSP